MIKFTILYREPADQKAFELFYTQNLALMERIPHVIRRQVSHVFGSPDAQTPFYRSLELYFEDRDKLDEAMTSAEGEAAGKHLMSKAAELVELYFSDVYEEAGGSTPVSDAGSPKAVDLQDEDGEPAEPDEAAPPTEASAEDTSEGSIEEEKPKKRNFPGLDDPFKNGEIM